MNKLSKLKLNEISFESLKEKEMRQVKGGDGCLCGAFTTPQSCSSYSSSNNFWGTFPYYPNPCVGPFYNAWI